MKKYIDLISYGLEEIFNAFLMSVGILFIAFVIFVGVWIAAISEILTAFKTKPLTFSQFERECGIKEKERA